MDPLVYYTFKDVIYMENNNNKVSELVKEMYEAGGKQKILKTKNLFLELAEAMFKFIDDKVKSNPKVNAIGEQWTGKLADVISDGLEKEGKKVLENFSNDLDEEAQKWLLGWGQKFVKTIFDKCAKIKSEHDAETIIKKVKKIFADVYKSYTSNGIWNSISGYWKNFKKYCNNDLDFVEDAYYNCQEEKQ